MAEENWKKARKAAARQVSYFQLQVKTLGERQCGEPKVIDTGWPLGGSLETLQASRSSLPHPVCTGLSWA